MKRNILNILLYSLFVLVTMLTIYNMGINNPYLSKTTDLDTSLSHEEIVGTIVKRITYERDNLRYIEQQEELQRVLHILQNNKRELEIVAKSFQNHDPFQLTGILFRLDTLAARYYAEKARKQKHLMRCLMVFEDGNPSFRYSNWNSYLNVKNNPELEASIKVLNSNIVYSSIYNDYAEFTLHERYFKEKEKINFVYYFNLNEIGYLTNGICVGEGWIIQIVGYNQHYRDGRLDPHYPHYPQMPDDAYPYLFREY